MRKFLTLLIVLATLTFFGCKKPTGTLSIDNYSPYYITMNWGNYNLSCGAYGVSSQTVESGTHTAYGYADGYSLGSMSVTVPEDGHKTIYFYKKKSSDELKSSDLTIEDFEFTFERPNIEKFDLE